MDRLMEVRVAKLQALRAADVEPFAGEFPVRDKVGAILSASGGLTVEQLQERPRQVSIAGRIMTNRPHGKAGFAHLQDGSGQIQVYVRQDLVGPRDWVAYEQLDLGDIVGVEGHLFRTRTGELTVEAATLRLLTKAIRPLPDKHAGLRDVEERYRNRHVDLIVNPEVRDRFVARSKAITAMRRALEEQDFLEVETPVLLPVAGGAAARPFLTHHNALDIPLAMRIATELHLKRLVVGGMERVYEIGRVFRNEGTSAKHNPEFTSLEAYQAYAGLPEMMALTRRLVRAACKAVTGSLKVTYQGTQLDFGSNWRQASMVDLVREATGLDFAAIADDEGARAAAERIGVSPAQGEGWGELLQRVFEAKAEQSLTQPTFVTGHPTALSPLARRSPEDPRISERFELYIVGREIANAFSELTDPIDQRQRFEDQLRRLEMGLAEAHPLDEEFLQALETGLPPTGGLGIGVDRLVMLLVDAPSIKDVILFPTMRSDEG